MTEMPDHPVTASDPLAAGQEWSVLADFVLPSTPGSERRAMEQVAGCARATGIRPAALERLKTAVAEAALNAIEHGNHFRAELPVQVRVACCPAALRVEICDRGEDEIRPCDDQPGLEAKLADAPPVRGWGLFLIQRMVDEMKVRNECEGHVVELTMYLHAPPAGSVQG
jgi:anti-sigma regulatory factor (Ser/Thr protein kinase)